ncbi:MAG: DUF5666 domain-containing protein [Pseudomonadota bacterium]
MLAACAPGARVADRSLPEPEGGIGGTGIVGTLTAFGSLQLNGLRVELDEATAWSDPFGSRPAGAVAIGMSLTVEATEVEGRLLARRVHVTYPLVGPVEAVEQGGAVLRVLGIEVRRLDGATGGIGPGQIVAVSGLWRGGRVEADRIDPAPPASEAAVSGVFSAGDDGPRVGGVPIDGPAVADLPEPGSFVTVTGRWADGVLTTRRLILGRFTGAAGPLERLSIEGYLEPVATDPGYTISGLGHSFDSAAELGPFAEARTLFEGPYTGTFDAATGAGLPQEFAARRAVLDLPAALQAARKRIARR